MSPRSNIDANSVDGSGFDALSALAYREAGLVLAEGKAQMIQSRLRHRLQALGIHSLGDYCLAVENDDTKQERRHMISALTTNVSGFFREPHHFEQLVEEIVPKIKQRLDSGKPVRIWSAGCSNGQEPYSIAMTLMEAEPAFLKADLKILATDIDPEVINFARHGEYKKSQISGIKENLLEKHCQETNIGGTEATYRFISEIRNFISFRELNLLGTWPMKGQFDAIFCRNVVIYFDSETQARLWPKFHNILRPDGIVFVGHSERINDANFKSCGATAYCKTSSTNVAK